MLSIWDILGTIAIICLIISFFIGKNAVWGGLSLGIIISIIVLVINLIIGNGFNWDLYKIILIISILAGALFEIVGRISSKK